MTLSVWRYAHLVLAIFSCLFLVLASVTGVILAVDAVQEKIPSYRVDGFNNITVAQALTALRKSYPEITEVSVDHNKFVILQGMDEEGNDVHVYVDPLTGKALGKPEKKSDFIHWVTAFHRSLFLKEVGRLFIGFISFLLVLITATGIVLIIQRQHGFFRFFSRIIKDDWAQYYHVVTGRLALIPILIIAISGTHLSLAKLKLWPDAAVKTTMEEADTTVPPAIKELAEFAVFQHTLLADIRSIEFPFADDPEEYYTVKLKDREWTINQFNGSVVSEEMYPVSALLETLSLDLHTGRTSIVWAIVLGIASLNILFFIYSGLTITWKRIGTRVRNPSKPEESNFILLTGSENGSTLRFANAVHQQLLSNKQTSYLTELNNYTVFPKAEHIVVFTSTHGLGDAPSNAMRFVSLVPQHPQKETVQVSVVGFGSKAYPDFCGYAKEVETLLSNQEWAQPSLPLHTVNDKSPDEFVAWIKSWSSKIQLPLATTPAVYSSVPADIQKMTVLDKTTVTDNDNTFILTLRPGLFTRFTSGDLLAIYPEGKERLYSIGKSKGKVQLVVKLHPDGLGSNYLYGLTTGSVIEARIIRNASFHFPVKTPTVVMIANGTGIAPFLGMIEQNKKQAVCHLYVGFRHETAVTRHYRKWAEEQIERKQLKNYQVAYSREANSGYVMDLLRKDAAFFANVLEQNGMIMICGSLSMQQDVESALDRVCREKNSNTIVYYKSRGQVLADCY